MNEDSVTREVDQLVETIPDSILDARSYYWPNFVQPRYIRHSFKKFVYSIELPTPIRESRAYYIASFGESLLLTWVGIETKVDRRIGASTNMIVRVVLGNDPYTSEHKDVARYCKVPTPIRSQEPSEIHLRRVEDKVDIGYRVHERVHKDFGIELVTRFNDVALVNTVVVLKVQIPALVGGTEDHYTWNQGNMKIENILSTQTTWIIRK